MEFHNELSSARSWRNEIARHKQIPDTRSRPRLDERPKTSLSHRCDYSSTISPGGQLRYKKDGRPARGCCVLVDRLKMYWPKSGLRKSSIGRSLSMSTPKEAAGFASPAAVNMSSTVNPAHARSLQSSCLLYSRLWRP